MQHIEQLDYYLESAYPFVVSIDEDGGFLIEFPDLPGCFTQAENLSEIAETAEEIRVLWIETAYESGQDIPAPSLPHSYSGKFNVRIPRSMHRQLAETAAHEGISLNQYVVAILSNGLAADTANERLKRIEFMLLSINNRLRYNVSGVPPVPKPYAGLRIVSNSKEAVAV